MSKLIDPLLRIAFVLGVVSALAVGGQAVFASAGVTSCFCDPADPDPDQDCVDCCMEEDSICPTGGTGPRMCICA